MRRADITMSTDLSTAAVQYRAARGAAPLPQVLQVALDAPLPRPFDYLPPVGSSASDIPVGARVRVPVGSRRQVGVVVGRTPQSALPAATLRCIEELIDPAPVLPEELLQLLRWTADYYHHPLGEVIAAALPKALREGRPAVTPVEVPRGWRMTPEGHSATPARAPAQRAILELLAKHPDGCSEAQLQQLLPPPQ